MTLTTVEFVSATKDVVLALAGAITAACAAQGLNTWSRQLQGTAGFEVARALARSTYAVRDSVQACRSPIIWAAEFPSEYIDAGPKRTAQQSAHGYAFVYAKRWGPVAANLQDFDTATLEAEALWGEEVRTATDKLRLLVRKLNASIDAFVDNEASGRESFQLDRNFMEEINAIVSSSPTVTDNSFNIELTSAIASVNNLIRPHLRRA